MIDNVRIQVIDKVKFENHVENSKIIQLQSSVALFTGELTEYPKKGKEANLEVRISKHIAAIIGSLHKYFNILHLEKNHNHNSFYYSQIVYVVNHLCELFQVQERTSLTNLEFGFNLEVEADPQKIIDYNILMYDLKNHNRDMKFSGKGDFKEFQKSDYSLKLYNKSKQYRINKNIFRVEIKITKKRLLEKLGIFKIEDLLRENIYNKLFDFLEKEFTKVLIIDEFHGLTIPEKDIEKLNKYSNPNYWNTLRKDKNYKRQNRLKKDFNLLISKYGLDKTKNELLEKMKSKFILLMDSNTLREVA